MYICNITTVYDLGHKRHIDEQLETVDDNYEEYGSKYVEHEIGERNSLCFLVCADSAKNDSHTLTDVLTYYNRYGGSVCDDSG